MMRMLLGHLLNLFRNKEAGAISVIFACSGIVFGSWASLIPYVKGKFSLDEAELGLLLLSMPVGNFLVNPASVVLIRRIGASTTALIFAVLTGFAFLLPMVFPSIPMVAIGLFLSGAFFGITNVAMNTAASALEENSEVRFISACHGMWSVGAMFGALLSGLALVPFENCCGHWMDPQKLYVLIQAIIVTIIILLIRKFPHPSFVTPNDQATSAVKRNMLRPGKELWLIISICLCTYLAEGTVTDWSAVFLRDETGASETVAGRGFAVYALFMAVGRFLGDGLIARFGNMQVLRSGGYLTLVGWLIIIFAPTHFLAMPGFMMAGAGISLASPILYQAAAKVKGLAQGVGLATMNAFAMAAFLGGPVLIGFIAQLSSLRIAFAFVAFVVLIWIIQTTRILNFQKRE